MIQEAVKSRVSVVGVVTGLRGITVGQWGRGGVGQCTLAFRRAETGAHTD